MSLCMVAIDILLLWSKVIPLGKETSHTAIPNEPQGKVENGKETSYTAIPNEPQGKVENGKETSHTAIPNEPQGKLKKRKSKHRAGLDRRSGTFFPKPT